MTNDRIRGMFALLVASAIIFTQFAASDAFAIKDKFDRIKVHANVGTVGNTKPAQPTINPAFSNGGGQDGNDGPGGPRKDKIDLSVCELGTFDHGECLGGD